MYIYVRLGWSYIALMPVKQSWRIWVHKSHPGHYPVYPPTPPWSYKSQYHEWTTHFTFIPCQLAAAHSWDKAISNSDLETWRLRSWVWSYGRPSILLVRILCISHQSDQQPRYSYFEIWPWKFQGQGHEWGQRSRSHRIPSIQPMNFLFHINRTNHSWDMAKRMFDLEKHLRNY